MSAVEPQSPAARAAAKIALRRPKLPEYADEPCKNCKGKIVLRDWAHGKRRRCSASDRWEDNCPGPVKITWQKIGDRETAITQEPPSERPETSVPEPTGEELMPMKPRRSRLREILYEAIIAIEAERARLSEVVEKLKELTEE